MTNPTGLKLKLKYLPPAHKMEPNEIDNYDPQPVMALLKGNKTLTKLVPIIPLTEHDKCIGCIAESNFAVANPLTDCYKLPKCDNAIYVRANPTNLLRHLMWRLENDL
jgi:hypothetical protein